MVASGGFGWLLVASGSFSCGFSRLFVASHGFRCGFSLLSVWLLVAFGLLGWLLVAPLPADKQKVSVQVQMSSERVGDRPTSWAMATAESGDGAREALTFLLSPDGASLGRDGSKGMGGWVGGVGGGGGVGSGWGVGGEWVGDVLASVFFG